MLTRRARNSAVAGVAGLLVFVAPASAGTAHVSYGTLPFDDGGTMLFQAAPGERNAVTLYADGFRDARHPVTAGPGCVVRSEDPHRVFCGPHERVDTHLGDGDDSYRTAPSIPPLDTHVYADTGDDVLIGGPGRDELTGAPGRDKIYGGPGDDQLRDGVDVVLVNGARQIVPADDILYGGPGNDGILGRYGRDRLRGGAGHDRLYSPDTQAANGTPIVPLAQDEEIDCGPGTDLAGGDYGDGVARTCEFQLVRAPRWRTVRAGARRAIEFKARCAWLSRRRCRGRVLVRRAPAVKPADYWTAREAPELAPPRGCPTARRARRLAVARFDIRAGRVGRVSVPVTRRIRGALKKRKCVAALVHFSFRGRDRWFESTRSLALRRVTRR